MGNRKRTDLLFMHNFYLNNGCPKTVRSQFEGLNIMAVLQGIEKFSQYTL